MGSQSKQRQIEIIFIISMIQKLNGQKSLTQTNDSINLILKKIYKKVQIEKLRENIVLHAIQKEKNCLNIYKNMLNIKV